MTVDSASCHVALQKSPEYDTCRWRCIVIADAWFWLLISRLRGLYSLQNQSQFVLWPEESKVCN